MGSDWPDSDMDVGADRGLACESARACISSIWMRAGAAC